MLDQFNSPHEFNSVWTLHNNYCYVYLLEGPQIRFISINFVVCVRYELGVRGFKIMQTGTKLTMILGRF